MSIEKRLLHTALARFLNDRGFDWYYEFTVAGRFRVDFIATGKHETWLIDCKVKLDPKSDIQQLQLYHFLYGDPAARMMIVTPRTYKHSSYYAAYTQANVIVLQIDGDFTYEALHASYDGGFEKIIDLYPHRMGMMSRLSREQIAEILNANRHQTTLQSLAKKHNVHPSTIDWVWRVVARKSWMNVGYPPAFPDDVPPYKESTS